MFILYIIDNRKNNFFGNERFCEIYEPALRIVQKEQGRKHLYCGYINRNVENDYFDQLPLE